MKIIREIYRAIHNRFTGVVGHDASGRVLRVGDRVLLPDRPYIRSQYRLSEAVIQSRGEEGHLELEPIGPDADSTLCPASAVYRIPEFHAEGSWRVVSHSTGWTSPAKGIFSKLEVADAEE